MSYHETATSSVRHDWETPQEFFDVVNEEFNFTLDVCAVSETAKCSRYFTPNENGLAQKWSGMCWMNPPYGQSIPKWLSKAWGFWHLGKFMPWRSYVDGEHADIADKMKGNYILNSLTDLK